MSGCQWGGCDAAALPTPAPSGHFFCSEHHVAAAQVAAKTTVLIHTRPVRGTVGVAPQTYTAPARQHRPIGKVLPPVILAVFLVFTFLAPVVFWFAWLVFVPILWGGWQWGLPRNR